MLKQKLMERKPVDKSANSLVINDHTSPHFPLLCPITTNSPSIPLWQLFHAIECRLNHQLNVLSFVDSSLVAAVYNPSEYANQLHCQYLERFLRNRPRVLFVGINPGPWGMCQTGVHTYLSLDLLFNY